MVGTAKHPSKPILTSALLGVRALGLAALGSLVLATGAGAATGEEAASIQEPVAGETVTSNPAPPPSGEEATSPSPAPEEPSSTPTPSEPTTEAGSPPTTTEPPPAETSPPPPAEPVVEPFPPAPTEPVVESPPPPTEPVVESSPAPPTETVAEPPPTAGGSSASTPEGGETPRSVRGEQSPAGRSAEPQTAATVASAVEPAIVPVAAISTVAPGPPATIADVSGESERPARVVRRPPAAEAPGPLTCAMASLASVTAGCATGLLGAVTPAPIVAGGVDAAHTPLAAAADDPPESSGHGGSGAISPPLSPGPGSASGATSGAPGMGGSGFGVSAFLTLAGLLGLAAPRAMRRLRLLCRPWRTACFVLIPERPD